MKGLYRALFLILLVGVLVAGCRRAAAPAPEPEELAQQEAPASAALHEAATFGPAAADPEQADPASADSPTDEGAVAPSGAEASGSASSSGGGASVRLGSARVGGDSRQTRESDRTDGTAAAPGSRTEAAVPETPPDPLAGLGYTLAWEAPFPPAADREPPAAVALSLDGQRAGVRLRDQLLLLEKGKAPRQVPIPAGQSLTLSPILDGWYLTDALAGGSKLQAFDWEGTPRWEAEAPPGELYAAPTGAVLVTRQAQEGSYTHAFGPDGNSLWHTSEVGGAISFAFDGSVLIWDAHRGWQLRAPDGAVLRRATPPVEANPLRRLSADGRVIVDPETGRVEPVGRPVPAGETEVDTDDGAHGAPAVDAQGAAPGGVAGDPALATFYGPGRLLADNGADLYLFVRARGRRSRLEAFDAGGRPLWKVPAGALHGVISPDGAEVWLFSDGGVAVLDGATGESVLELDGVRAVWFSTDGRHALVWDGSRLAVYRRPDKMQTGIDGGDAPRPGNIE